MSGARGYSLYHPWLQVARVVREGLPGDRRKQNISFMSYVFVTFARASPRRAVLGQRRGHAPAAHAGMYVIVSIAAHAGNVAATPAPTC